MLTRANVLKSMVLVALAILFGVSAQRSISGTASEQRNIPVELIMFEQTACEWCELWDEEVGVVYHKTKEGKRAPLRRVNIHKNQPADLSAISPVVYTPTFVLIQNGVEIGRIRGYPGEDFFWGMLSELIGKLTLKTGHKT